VNPNEIVAKVTDALQRCSIPFMIVGSFSSNVHGVERSTKDADIVLQLDQPIGNLIKALGSDFHVDPQMGFETVTMTLRYIANHLAPPFKIELFMLSDDPHDKARFSRRRLEKIGDRKVFVASPEDVVITKLRWSKGGRRAKDVEDVRGVLAVLQGKLEMDYIRRWCTEHGTLDLLEKTLQSIPLLPPSTL
jgi:hypothetical protein